MLQMVRNPQDHIWTVTASAVEGLLLCSSQFAEGIVT